jgi:hypothetical protein|tara:strand:- start:295 stop:498 length:204 start_codon:yes stop_codon:yes gene_type:complete
MTVKTQLQEILSLITEAVQDAEKFDNGNDTAGKRVRIAAQEAKKKLQQLRTDIQTVRNVRKNIYKNK